MAFTIAVAGKGGTGKTTLAALIIFELLGRNLKPILAVDADPNVNLNVLLGIDTPRAVGSLREETLKKIKNMDFPQGMSKSMYIEYRLQECLAEREGIDLLVMGRPEGPGCYCFANDVLRKFIDTLTPNYHYVVIDSEAGMEHLSRRTTQNVDVLFIVSDENPVSLRSAMRINNLVDELELKISKRYLVLNNVNSDLSDRAKEEIKKSNLQIGGVIPKDGGIFSLALEEKPLSQLSPESPAHAAVEKLLRTAGVIS